MKLFKEIYCAVGLLGGFNPFSQFCVKTRRFKPCIDFVRAAAFILRFQNDGKLRARRQLAAYEFMLRFVGFHFSAVI